MFAPTVGPSGAARSRRRPAAAVVDDRVAVARDAALLHHEADELAREALGLLLGERLLADEALALDHPAEAGLERRVVLVDVVAVERRAAPRGAACRARRGRSA